MTADRFLDHVQVPIPTSEGPMDFPILYRDIGGFSALFSVDPARVEGYVAEAGLELVPVLGQAVVGVAFFTYRDCTIAPYNEAAVATQARPRRGGPRLPAAIDALRSPATRDVGTHILQLPVTTAQARAGGVEVYGYPKFVAGIELDFGHETFFGVTREKDTGDEIVSLEGRARWGVPVPGFDVMTWSRRNNELLRTCISMDSTLRLSAGHGFTLRVGRSKHPMARQLRAMGLDGARPFLVARGDSYRSVLPLGTAG